MPDRQLTSLFCWTRQLLLGVTVALTLSKASIRAETPGGDAPLLRIEAGGPVNAVSALAFSPNGQVLYAAGWDKVVNVWRLVGDRFEHDAAATYRVPIGGGLDGALSALAISQDGRWLAVGGRSAKRGIAGQREHGTVFPGASMSEEMWLDEGVIYVFDTQTRQARTFRGHRGAVVSLTFVPQSKDQPPVLLSIASTRHEGELSAELFAWDVRESSLLRKAGSYPEPAANGEATWKHFPQITPAFLPKLSAWRTGNSAVDVRVAITWGSAEFGMRIWDVGSGRMTMKGASDKAWYFLNTGWGERILTAGGNSQTGRVDIEAWTRPTGSLRSLVRGQDSRPLMTLPDGELAIAAASMTGTGQPVIVGGDQQTKQTRLVVLSADGKSIASQKPLWDGLYAAQMAVCPQGQHLALAHYGTGEIVVYRVAELDKPDAHPQRLHAAGTSFDHVTWMNSEDHIGLRLKRQNSSDELVFDLSTGAAVPLSPAWTPDDNDNGWRVTPDVADTETTDLAMTVTSPAGQTQKIVVAGNKGDSATELTAAAVCPASESVPIPLLIVAIHRRFEPELRIYNLVNGEWIRRLTGHTAVIGGISVTSDGRFAATVSHDHTVRVWQLSDLAEELGQHGLIRDRNTLLELVNVEGKILADNSVGGITAGSEITSVVRNGEALPLQSAWRVYEIAHLQHPGEALTLGVNTTDGPRALDVVLGQAIDDRKPLFSIYLLPPSPGSSRAGEGWSWIGWSPLGPFDASGPEAERHLGWHFNSPSPEQLTQFADVAEYRDAFYTPELLRHLITFGSLPAPQALAPPRLSLLITNAEGKVIDADLSEEVRVRDGRLSAILMMSGKFPLRLVRKVAGHVTTANGQTLGVDAVSAGDAQWTFDLSNIPWSRGRHQLTVQLTTGELEQRTFDEQLVLTFQPPPPQLRVETLPARAMQADLPLILKVTPASGTPARVVVLHGDAEWQTVTPRWEQVLQEPQSITRDLTLAPGFNRVTVIAENVGATYGLEGLETVQQTLEVHYAPSREPVIPMITLSEIESAGAKVALGPGDAGITVDSAQVTVHGVVRCDDELSRVLLRLRDMEVEVAGASTPREKNLPFSVDKTVTLAPGLTTLTMIAESATQGRAERQIEITYRPELPAIINVRVEPVVRDEAPQISPPLVKDDPTTLCLYDLLHESAVRIQAQIMAAASEHPFEVAMLIDGEPAAESSLQIENGTLQGTVTIPPGRHELKLQVSNAWQRVRTPWEQTVSYLRPPRILAVAAPATIDHHELAGVILTIESPTELPMNAEGTEVSVNGNWQQVRGRVSRAAGNQWTMTLDPIPLDIEGLNHLEFVASNSEGRTLQPGTHHVIVTVPPLPRPQIVVHRASATAQTALTTLEFTITSPSEVRDIRVTHNRSAVPSKPSLVSTEGESDRYELPVTLIEGQNLFALTAVNSGGASDVIRHTVSYVPRPLLVHVDQLGGLRPVRSDEIIQFPDALDASVAALSGSIEVSTDFDSRRAAQFWVNGFMQRAVEVNSLEGDPHRCPFEVNLFFNREQDNVVEVDLLDSAGDKSSMSSRRFSVNCRRPGQLQQMYLLIIGAAVQDDPGSMTLYKQELEQRALAALQRRTNATPGNTALRTIVMTGADATSRKIDAALMSLRFGIQPASGRGEEVGNSVLIIYYHGKEVRTGPDRRSFVLATSETWDDPNAQADKALSSEELGRRLNQIHGAHLLFLDVQTPEFAEQARWPSDPHLGIVRIASGVPGPKPYPLLGALEDVLPQRRMLEDVCRGIAQRLLDEPLLADFSIPSVLSRLEIGGP